MRRPSKSAIVNSSIALIHSHRRARALAGRELRALDEEVCMVILPIGIMFIFVFFFFFFQTHALRREINEWRARARATSGLPHLPPLQSPQRSSEFLALISESTNIDDKIVEEEERRAYLLAEGAPGDGDYDPEDSDDVNGGDCWTSPSSHTSGHNNDAIGSSMPLPPPPAQSPQAQWQAAAALQMQYAQAQALQQAQAQALQQAQMQSMVSVGNGIGNVGMNSGLMAMGMSSNGAGGNTTLGSLGVGPIGLVGVGLNQGQSPNAPTWSAHPSFSHNHSNPSPHSPMDSQPNPFAFTMSGSGIPDVSFSHGQQPQQPQSYQTVMHQNFVGSNTNNNGYGGGGNHHQRTPPSTTASSSAQDDDLAGSSPRSMSSGTGDSVASTPSPIVAGRQMNGNGNRNINRNINMNMNMNMNPGLSKTGWGLVGPHNIPNAMATNPASMMSLGGGGGMGVVSVAGMMI